MQVSDFWDVLDQIDALTKTLANEDLSKALSGLSRTARSTKMMKLRESYLRIGNVLEEWNAARSQKEG